MMKNIILITLIFSFYSCGTGLFSPKKKVYQESNQQKIWQPKKAVKSGNTALKVTGKVLPKEELKLVEKAKEISNKVEVSWVKPEVTVDGFILNYGFNEKVQDQTKKVFIKDLKVSKDEKHGSIYKYVLKNIPKDQEVYVRISAFLGDEVSEASDVMKVMK